MIIFARRFLRTVGINKFHYFFRSDIATTMDKEGGQKTGGGSVNLMDKEAASRIQAAEAKKKGGGVEKGSFASRAQSTADKRENQNN